MSDREELYKAVIGPRNQDYYLRRFLQFDASGKAGITWNLPAALLTFFWCIYRRMWLVAFGYILTANVRAVIIGAIVGEAASLLLLVAQTALPGMYANAIYHRHCKRKIDAAQAASGDLQQQISALEAAGGTGKGAAIALVAVIGVAVVGVLAAVAIPAYQSYAAKARLIEAVRLGQQAVASVEAYRQRGGPLPVTLAEAGFSVALPAVVYGVEMDGQAVVVTLRQGDAFPDGGRLIWQISSAPDGASGWKCHAQRVAPSMLPPDCL